MNASTAMALSGRVAEYWPTMRIPTRLWAEEFADLDEGTVGTVLVRMAQSFPRPPSIADFDQEYRATATPANDPLHNCHTCGGDGIITRWQTWRSIPTEVMDACPNCPMGDLMRKSLHEIGRRNADLLDRLHPDRDRSWSPLSEPPPLPVKGATPDPQPKEF